MRDAPRRCGCDRAGDEAAYLDGGAQHPDGHRQHGVAHLGELRAVGVARLFRCRWRGDERGDRRRDEVLRTEKNPDIRVRHGHDGGRGYRHEVDVHADDRVELLGDRQAGHALHAHGTQYGEHGGFTQAVGKAADGGCRPDARVEGIDGR